MATHLAAEANTDFIRLFKLRDGIVINSIELPIAGNSAEAKRKSTEELLESTNFVSDEYDDYSLAWSGNRSTLVPSNVFSDSKPEELFKLCFGENENDQEVDYNRISELSAVNLYEVPNWIKSAFVLKFPRIILQHTGSHVVRAVVDKDAFYLKATIVLFENTFLLTLTKHNKLEFYSYFDYSTVEDVIYHLSFALQQKELGNEKGSLEIVTGLRSNEELAKEVQNMYQRIDLLSALDFRAVDDFIAKSQLLCV